MNNNLFPDKSSELRWHAHCWRRCGFEAEAEALEAEAARLDREKWDALARAAGIID